MNDTEITETKRLNASDHAVEVFESILKNVQDRLYDDWLQRVRVHQAETRLKFPNGDLTMKVVMPDFGREAMTIVADSLISNAMAHVKK